MLYIALPCRCLGRRALAVFFGFGGPVLVVHTFALWPSQNESTSFELASKMKLSVSRQHASSNSVANAGPQAGAGRMRPTGIDRDLVAGITKQMPAAPIRETLLAGP